MPNSFMPDRSSSRSSIRPAAEYSVREKTPLDDRLTRALETAPVFIVPADFAAHVAAQAVSRFGPAPAAVPAFRFGPAAVRVAIAVLILAMLVLARYASTASTTALLLEATFCAEFIGLTLYLGLYSRRPY